MMRIDIPEHGLRKIAAEVAFHQREATRFQNARNFVAMDECESRLKGVRLVTNWLGERQSVRYDRMVNEERERQNAERLQVPESGSVSEGW